MGLESLRKHIQELKERGILGSGYETPEMNTYQPTSPSPVEPYNPPEVAVPISTNTQTPKTTPVSAPKPVVPTASTSNNTAKVDPKSGRNGLKAFTDITSKSPQFGETGIGNTDLIDAYNAGLNGTDLSRETRDNAAAGGYLDSIEAMFNAGLQDASLSKNVDGFSPEKVDNTKNLSYTAGNAAGSTTEDAVEPVEYTYTANRYGVSNVNNTNNSKTDFQTDHNFARYGQGEDEDDVIDVSTSSNKNITSSDEPYKITDEEKELNYMMDMLFMNGAGSSSDPSVQEAYQWLMNPNKKIEGEKVYNEKLKQTKEAFYSFMGGILDDQIVRSNKIADGSNKSEIYGKILNGTYKTRFAWMPDENYYKQMMALNGAGESADPKVRDAYKYLTDSKNKGKLPEDIKDIFYNFMGSIQDEDQKIRAYEVTTGIDLEGLYEDEKIKTGPYAGKIVSGGFNDPGTNNQGHMANDIKGTYGSYIHPILDGKIVYVHDSNSTGNGRMVVIEHELPNGTKYYSSYSHLSDVSELKEGMQVSKNSNIGKMGGSAWGEDYYFGTHVHIMVYTREKPYETPYILDPHGYASKDLKNINGTDYHKFNFKDAECTYGQYYCITHKYKGKINDYNNIVFYDPNIVMLTNGEIINLFPYKYIKKE